MILSLRNRSLVLGFVALLTGALIAAVALTRGKDANANARLSARGMAGLARSSTQLSTNPRVLSGFPADMAPSPGTAHLLTTRADVSVYAWPDGADSVCVAHSGGGGGCFTDFVTPVNSTISDPDRLGAGHPVYVWGVTTDAVTSVDVVVSGTLHSVPVTNNAFVYTLSKSTAGPETIEGLVAHLKDGTVETLPPT